MTIFTMIEVENHDDNHVVLRHIHVAAESMEEASVKWKEYATKRFSFGRIKVVYCFVRITSDVIESTAPSILTHSNFYREEASHTQPWAYNGQMKPPSWVKVHEQETKID